MLFTGVLTDARMPSASGERDKMIRLCTPTPASIILHVIEFAHILTGIGVSLSSLIRAVHHDGMSVLLEIDLGIPLVTFVSSMRSATS